MNFSVLDHYNGFVLNNFIKKDHSQIDLLNKISLTWNQYNKNNIFNSKKKRKGGESTYQIQEKTGGFGLEGTGIGAGSG